MLIFKANNANFAYDIDSKSRVRIHKKLVRREFTTLMNHFVYIKE